MNGLKYIRIQCNFSLNELADVLGVTRQAISSWETNQKGMPPNRREQIAEFFGVDEHYLGEITDDDVRLLQDRVMFSYIIQNKEVRLFRPKEGTKSLDRQYMTFADDSAITLDEKYARAKKRKKDILDKADCIIRDFDRCSYIQDKTNIILRRCKLYDALNLVIEDVGNKPIISRVPYFHEIEAVLSAMLYAYGILSEEEALNRCSTSSESWFDNRSWFLSLTDMLKTHWADKEQALDSIMENLRTQGSTPQEQTASATPKSLQEEIVDYEAFCKEVRSSPNEK